MTGSPLHTRLVGEKPQGAPLADLRMHNLCSEVSQADGCPDRRGSEMNNSPAAARLCDAVPPSLDPAVLFSAASNSWARRMAVSDGRGPCSDSAAPLGPGPGCSPVPSSARSVVDIGWRIDSNVG